MRGPLLPNGWLEARRAVETQHRSGGLGLLMLNGDGYYEDEYGWYSWDDYGTYWGDWSGGYADSYGTSTGWWADDAFDPYSDLNTTLNWWENLDNTIYSNAPFLPSNPGTTTTSDPWLPDNFWDWMTGIFDQNANPAGYDGTPTNDPVLPGYCPAGTYHPVDNPYVCVPFPPNDPNAKRRAQQQQQTAQKAAQAARAAQQRQDKQCPRDPQGRPVWRNPQTGKCELVPQCPQGSRFDSATRRCLTPAQLKAAYGDNNWLWWLLGGGAALLLLTRDSGGRRR